MKNTMINLLAFRCVYWKGKLYCMASHLNLLFSVNLQDGTIEPVDAIPEEDILINYPCGDMEIWHDKLIFSPNAIKKVWIYDLVSKRWDSIEIDYPHLGSRLFPQIHIYKDTAFLIGATCPAIACINLKDNSCYYIEAPYKNLIAKHDNAKFCHFYFHGARVEDTLYLASCHGNFVLKFNMETKEHHWIELGDKSYVYSEIEWDGENFWLSPMQKGDIVKWDGGTNIDILPLSQKLDGKNRNYGWTSRHNGKHIILSSTSYPKSIVIDRQKNSIQICESQYSLLEKLDNGLLVSQTTDGKLSVTTEDSHERVYHIAVSTDWAKRFLFEEKNIQIFDKHFLYHEIPNHPVLSLENFLSFMKSQPETGSPSNGQVGKRIWEYIR